MNGEGDTHEQSDQALVLQQGQEALLAEPSAETLSSDELSNYLGV